MNFTEYEKKFCIEFTDMIFKHKLSIPFQKPVRPNEDGAPDYYDKITNPMDLGILKNKLENNEYTNSTIWKSDLELIWKNAMSYNKEGTPINSVAKKLDQKCKKRLRVIPTSEYEGWKIKLEYENRKMLGFLSEAPKESLVPVLPSLSIQQC